MSNYQYPTHDLKNLVIGDDIWLYLDNPSVRFGCYPLSITALAYKRWVRMVVTFARKGYVELKISDKNLPTFSGSWFCIEDAAHRTPGNEYIKHVSQGHETMWSFHDPTGDILLVKANRKPQAEPKPQVCKGYNCPDPVNPYAEPNQPDGSFLCYTCRSVWRPKDPRVLVVPKVEYHDF